MQVLVDMSALENVKGETMNDDRWAIFKRMAADVDDCAFKTLKEKYPDADIAKPEYAECEINRKTFVVVNGDVQFADNNITCLVTKLRCAIRMYYRPLPAPSAVNKCIAVVGYYKSDKLQKDSDEPRSVVFSHQNRTMHRVTVDEFNACALPEKEGGCAIM